MNLSESERTAAFDQLFERAQLTFEQLKQELARYEVQPSRHLRLVRSSEYRYDFERCEIHMLIPDLSDPLGKFFLLYIKDLLNCQDDEELIEFLDLLQQHGIAHEMAHHLRHHFGCYDVENLWQEEQLANQFAAALVKPKLSTQQKTRSQILLRQALDGFADQAGNFEDLADSFGDVLQAFVHMGELEALSLNRLELFGQLLQRDAQDLLLESGQLSADLTSRLASRDALITTINSESSKALVRYMFYTLGWIYFEITSQVRYYVDEFVREALGQDREVLLLPPSQDAHPAPAETAACYFAARELGADAPVASRYFRKRYRTQLMAHIKAVPVIGADRSGHALVKLLEGSQDMEGLELLKGILPKELQQQLPGILAERATPSALVDQLPTDEDRRIWQLATGEQADPAAARTLSRLKLLEGVDVFGSLPVEVLLPLAQRLYRLDLADGETVIWHGETNSDLYFLSQGRLEVWACAERCQRPVAELGAGALFGEMAFLTGEARSAHVRATGPAVCYALRAPDFQVIAYQHPEILMQLAAVLAQRVETGNRKLLAIQDP
jgi:hypothetical protein